MTRIARILLAGIAAVLVLLFAALVVLNGTYYGRERVRRYALDALRNMVHGEVVIGRIDGNLLDYFDLVDVSITDEDEQPFLVADRIRARLALAPLLARRLVITSIELFNPTVTLSKDPGAEWNYKRIFASGDTVQKEIKLGFGSWIDLHGITVHNGTLFVHQPFPTDEPLRKAVRDSIMAAAMAGDTRFRVERDESGLRQTMEFHEINARIPRLVAADPDSTAVSFRVRQLSMLAGVLQAPDVLVREFSGDVRVTDDSVAVGDANLRLRDSRIGGGLVYNISNGDVDLDLKSDTLAFADVRVLYPPLPAQGGGRLELRAYIRDTGISQYDVRNARLAVGESRVSGQLGMAVGTHVLEFRDTDVRFTRLTTQLVERLVPGLSLRVPGAFTGVAKLDGPSEAVHADVNGSFDPARHPPFNVTVRGVVGSGSPTIARNLRVNLEKVPVSLVREFVKDFPLDGTVNAFAVVSGSTANKFTGHATLTHNDRGATSMIVADGSVAPNDSMRMQVDLRFAPVSLEVLEAFVPGVDWRGNVTGLGDLRGTLGDLRAELALELPVGTVDVDGTFNLAAEVPSYTTVVEIHDLDTRALAPSLPLTSLNGIATVVGRGTDPKTMDARLTMHLLEVMIDSAKVVEAVAVATARNAQLTVDTMRLRTPFGAATANGTLGLVEGNEGTLTYAVDVNTLSGLRRWIATHDSSVVALRPLAQARAAAHAARADSIRSGLLTDSVNIAALATRRVGQTGAGQPPVVLPADTLGRDSIGGAVSVRGTIKGSTQKFTAAGKAAISQVIWNGNEIGRGTADFTWADVRTPDVLLSAEIGVDSVRAAGFAFDSTHVKATYRSGNGDLSLSIFPGDTAAYRLRATYALSTEQKEVRLQDVNLRFDSTAWASTRPSTIRWRGGGLAVDSLELRSGEGKGSARIYVSGEIPDDDPGRMVVRVDSLRVAPWLTLLQSNLPVDGIATVSADVEGTRRAPRIRGSVALERPLYKATPFPEVHSDFNYADRKLQFAGSLRRAAADRAQLAQLRGELPVDLSFGDSVEKRTLDGPISIDIEGDSIPLGPIAEFVDAFSAFNGHAKGRIGVRGTWNDPHLEGAIDVNIARLGLRATGATFTNTVGRVHMADDRLVIDTLVAHSSGTVRATGSIVLEKLDRPVLDLNVIADKARVMDNQHGQLVMSSRLALKGPLDTMAISGSTVVNHGLIRIPDPEEWHLINTGDPVVFSVADTALQRQLQILPPSPFLKNAAVNVRLKVDRGTWARSREANVEVYGDLLLERSVGDEEMSVKGALFSDYGDYELYGRRFRISRGAVRFTGPPTNPVLQLVAIHEVRQAGRAPFDIQVTIGGTLDQPNISLESQAQPTLTQSDLISFLAFGQSTTSLLQFDGSGFEGGGASGSSMAGNVAVLATRQLAGVALGALFAQLEADLAEQTAADVLNIRPADLPPGLSLSGVRAVALGTQIEIGKYLDHNTFAVGTFRPTFTLPGLMVEHRFGSQLKARTSLEPRYLPQVPSLTNGLQPKIQQVFGVLLFWTRTW